MNNDRYTSASSQNNTGHSLDRSVSSENRAMQNMNDMTDLERRTAIRQRDQERMQPAKKRKPTPKRLFGLIPVRRKKHRWVYAFFAALALEINQAKESAAEKKAQRSKRNAEIALEGQQTQKSEEFSRREAKTDRRRQKFAAVQVDEINVTKPPVQAADPLAVEEEFQNLLNSFLTEDEKIDSQTSTDLEQPTVETEEFQIHPDAIPDEEEASQISADPEQPATEENEFQSLLNSFLTEEEEKDFQPSIDSEQSIAEDDEFQNLLNSFLAEEEEKDPQPSTELEQPVTEEDEFQILLNSFLGEDEEKEPEESLSPEQLAEEEREFQILLNSFLAEKEGSEAQILPIPVQPVLEKTENQVPVNPALPVEEETSSLQTDEIQEITSDENEPVATKKSKRSDKKIWITAVLIFCAIMLATLIYLGIRSVTAANDFRKLSQLVSEKEAELSGSLPTEAIPVATVPASNGEAGTGELPEETEPVVKTILPKYADLVVQNPEMFGWVRIEDTVLDYPVMRSTMDNEKYLYANFDGKYSFAGTPFADNQCSSDSDNLVIYGHNIKDGSMFRSLFKYEKESYWKKHPTIMYSDLYEDYEYEVMAVFYDRVYEKTEDVFKFYQFIDAENEEAFDYAVEQFKAKSLYDTGVDAQYGDQLITLVTCSYQVENGRFVVVARRK